MIGDDAVSVAEHELLEASVQACGAYRAWALARVEETLQRVHAANAEVLKRERRLWALRGYFAPSTAEIT